MGGKRPWEEKSCFMLFSIMTQTKYQPHITVSIGDFSRIELAKNHPKKVTKAEMRTVHWCLLVLKIAGCHSWRILICPIANS